MPVGWCARACVYLTCANASERDSRQPDSSLIGSFSDLVLRDPPDFRCGESAPGGTSWAVVATKEPPGSADNAAWPRAGVRLVKCGSPALSPGQPPAAPAPAQAKTTVRCPLSSTRCSVCQRTACASTRRSTSCPLACSTDTESSCPARVTSCSMIGPSSRSAVT